MAAGTAHVTDHGVYPLQAGKSCVFGAAFASNLGYTVSPGYCRGDVLIVKTTPS